MPVASGGDVYTATPAVCPPTLRFREPSRSDAAMLRQTLGADATRVCDLTVGGILLWAPYFRYRLATDTEGTLYIMGVTEDSRTIPAFSVPIGPRPLDECVALLRRYCAARGLELKFSAVPEPYLEPLVRLGATEAAELRDFADYLYDIEPLATLRGKKLSKKRNHVNRFEALCPGYRLLEPDLLPGGCSPVEFLDSLDVKDGDSAHYEHEMSRLLLMGDPEAYGFVTRALWTPAHGIVAVTVGEVMGDTLHVHIEKADHRVEGAGEAVNALFCREMLARYPGLRYVNRQDDAGDPGLRQAKESYHPCMLLRKYNVSM